MKYFHWFKGVFFIALACSFTAQGSTDDVVAAKKNPTNHKSGAIGSSTVIAGQSQDYRATADLIISGESNPLTVEKEGRVTLTAGKSILLLPGTRISAGGFLYASIESTGKSGKHQKKGMRLVTVEENKKIEEQASLCMAFNLFKPIHSRNRGNLHAGDAEQGSFRSSNNELSAVSPEQQRKVALHSRTLSAVARKQISTNYHPVPVASTFRTETMMVLRL